MSDVEQLQKELAQAEETIRGLEVKIYVLGTRLSNESKTSGFYQEALYAVKSAKSLKQAKEYANKALSPPWSKST